jgi:hypothetical protein
MRMDPAIKHWVGLWDYLDGNFWHVWQWAANHLSPDQVAWQPIPIDNIRVDTNTATDAGITDFFLY